MPDFNPKAQAAVAEVLSALTPALLAEGPLTPERCLAALWPYVQGALDAAKIEAPPPEASRDKRAKPWQYTVRFWRSTPAGPELEAETDPMVMPSTGALPGILQAYGEEMHPGACPPELQADAVKGRLQQLRNNLGRHGASALRIEYKAGLDSYLCQVDVIRLET